MTFRVERRHRRDQRVVQARPARRGDELGLDQRQLSRPRRRRHTWCLTAAVLTRGHRRNKTRRSGMHKRETWQRRRGSQRAPTLAASLRLRRASQLQGGFDSCADDYVCGSGKQRPEQASAKGSASSDPRGTPLTHSQWPCSPLCLSWASSSCC